MARKKKRPQQSASDSITEPEPTAPTDPPSNSTTPSKQLGPMGNEMDSVSHSIPAPEAVGTGRTRDPVEQAIENEVLSRLMEAQSSFWEGVRVGGAGVASTRNGPTNVGKGSKTTSSPTKTMQMPENPDVGRQTSATLSSAAKPSTAGAHHIHSNAPPTPPPPPPVSLIPPPSRSPHGPLHRLRIHLDRAIHTRPLGDDASISNDPAEAARALRVCVLGLASLGHTDVAPPALTLAITSLRAASTFVSASQLITQARGGSQSAGCLSLIMQACGVPGMGLGSREEARSTLEQLAGTWAPPTDEVSSLDGQQRRRSPSPGKSTLPQEKASIWNLLGQWATEGFAGEVDLGKAFGWYEKASRAGTIINTLASWFAAAMYPLARMFALGHGILPDPQTAVRWHARYIRRYWSDLASRILADPPRGWIEAARGVTSRNATGAPQTLDPLYPEALEAVPLEDFSKLAISHYVVGRAGELGGFETEGVARDATESSENYYRAVAAGADSASRFGGVGLGEVPDGQQRGYAHFPSLLRLALGTLAPAHLQHDYLPRTVLETAATHLMCATPRSAFELFVWHTERQDTSEAALQLVRACAGGHLPAMLVLARCHIESVTSEPLASRRAALTAEAAKLYRCAAAAGHTEAARAIAGMEKSGTTDTQGRPDEGAGEKWRKATRVAASTGGGQKAMQGLGAQVVGEQREEGADQPEKRGHEAKVWFSRALRVNILTDVGGVRYCATGREDVNWDAGARFDRGGNEAIVRLGGGSAPPELSNPQLNERVRWAVVGNTAALAAAMPPPSGTDPTDILRHTVDLMTTPERPNDITELIENLLRGAGPDSTFSANTTSSSSPQRAPAKDDEPPCAQARDDENSARDSFQSSFWAEKFRSVAPTLTDIIEVIENSAKIVNSGSPGGMVGLGNAATAINGAISVNGSETTHRSKRTASRILFHLRDLKFTLHDAEKAVRSGGDRYLDALRLFSEVLLSPYFWIFDFQNPVLRLLCALCARYDMSLNPTDPYGIAVEAVVAIRERAPEVSLALLQQCIDMYRADGREDLGEQCKVVFFWPRVWLLMRLDRWEEAVTQLTGMMVWIEQNMQEAPDKGGKLYDTYTLEYLEAEYWRAVCIISIHERKGSMTKSPVMEGQAPPLKDDNNIVGSMFTRAMAVDDLKNYLSRTEGDECVSHKFPLASYYSDIRKVFGFLASRRRSSLAGSGDVPR
ncbi:hypothetical protein HDU93_003363 [Gonapodya sp. JEL0774]|nr:hypothetical protein HDU93_003363 [Gonapodya sp. JEL0774]